MLLIHVKDHNNLGRSTPLGRVQIPLSDLCHASATSTSIASTALKKRYALMPEPWMKKHAQDLGEICIKTEVVGDATMLAEMLQRVPKNSPEKLLSFLSFSSFTSDPYMQGSQLSQEMTSAVNLDSLPEYEDEVTEVLERGKEIRTATAIGNKAKWRKEKFQLSLSYPGMFSDTTTDKIEHYTLHLRVHSARNLLGPLGSAPRHNAAKALGEAGEYQYHYHRLNNSAFTNAYFTVIPVLGNGELEHREKKQGLTVYGNRSPHWPEQNFVFGKIKDISTISYLSLHVYTRNLPGELTLPLSLLLEDKKQDAHLKRHQLHKLGPSGEVDDDGFEVLRYDQRVLAFRACQNGGRFFPARVQRYFPFPKDEYLVLFEGSIETIEDIRNIFSIDVKGKIKAIRADGSADVVPIDKSKDESADETYFSAVPVALLMPVQAFSASIEKTLAKRIKKEEFETLRWKNLKHSLSALKVELLSVSDLSNEIKRPGCLVTLVGNRGVSTKKSRNLVSVHSDGKMVAKKTISGFEWGAGEIYELPVAHDAASKNVDDMHYFENKAIVFGNIQDGELDDDDEEVSTTVSQRELIDDGADILVQVSSILIRIVDQGEDDTPSHRHRTLGYAKIDLAALHDGEQMMHLNLIPTEQSPYYKFVGSLSLHVSCVDAAKKHEISLSNPGQKAKHVEKPMSRATVCGLSEWYTRRQASEDHSSSLTTSTRLLSRIERREVLRSSLTPTENAQIDAFHTVLTMISKRIVSILREIQLFEQFEVLKTTEMPKFRHVHTINADPKSEWLGRMVNQMKVETRKDIVLHLEMELLDLAGSDLSRVYPAADLSRDGWVKLRTVRQHALQKDGGFFTQDRTTALVLLHSSCFTGDGMISWILRDPPILWKDQWTKYCHDSAQQKSCLLRWEDPKLKQNPDAMQPPGSREDVLVWLSALSDAGYIENVTSSGALTDANRSHYVVEDKSDHYYRLREVELWMSKQSRDKSLFPLDLVRELDCYQPSHPTSITAAVSAGKLKASKDPEATHKQVFSKKLSAHVDGFLGTQNTLTNLVISTSVMLTTVNKKLKPLAEKTKDLLDEDVLYDWKYCLFLPSNLTIYMYECETSSSPFAVIDMNSAACNVGYNLTIDAKGGWFEIASATIFLRQPGTLKLVPMKQEQAETMLTTKNNGAKVLEFKSTEAQRWVMAFAQAGVRMNMQVGQLVVMKRLNEKVLHQKCIEFETEYQLNDLEGSFQRLLNRVFQHHLDSSHSQHEEKLREMRAKLRSEMKKFGAVGGGVLAYFGKGMRLNPKPTNARSFTSGALYSGRVMRVRTPYVDAKYHVKVAYERNDTNEVPQAMDELLLKYKVKDKASWLKLPKSLRDVFLLYDIEYRHSNEIIIEEGMLREHFRTADGDLDPKKVEECCTDSNVVFKPNDLEDCITRMAVTCSGRKPLGCLKIPIKTVSPHRVIDTWYPLAPENEMVQKMQLGQIRVQLRLHQINQLVRSKHTPAILEELKEAATKPSILQPLVSNPIKFFKDAVYPRKRSAALPSGGGVFTRERSFLKVSILEARKLLHGDFFLERNPFVKIILMHEQNEREEYTLLKADVKPKTLNPKWQNQEFMLGRTENSVLSDKKAVLLRVMDDNAVGEIPLGFVKIELQRDKAGFITGLMLVHADSKGCPTSRALHLNQKNKVEVDAMLLGSKQAKGNDPEADGRLGKLRFDIELIRNENFVEATGELASSPTKMVAAKHLDTKFSVDLKIQSVVVAGKADDEAPETAVFDWKQYSCVFQPHGEGGQRVLFDAHSEDLAQGNKHRLSDLISQSKASGLKSSTRLLGRTYDVSKVAYFDVLVSSDATGKSFRGKFGQNDILKDPEYISFRDEVIVLKDKDNKDLRLHMTIDFDLVGVHRAERVKRVLAETFRLVGMPFDAKTMSHSGSTSSNQAHLSNSAQAFLWEIFKVSIFPGRNVTQELLAQVRRMSRSTKLHWRFTPQLLCYVFEHVFCGGEKDLLTYTDAAALDVVLNRWSQVLSHVSEAKNQLIGHLHGRETPQLVQTLFTNCDWMGFEFAPSATPVAVSESSKKGAVVIKEKAAMPVSGEHDREGEIMFRPGDRVHASLPLCKHAGVAVDVCLLSRQFVAGTIIREYGDDSYDVAFCTAAKVREESDEYFSDDDELPPLIPGQLVYACPLAKAGSIESHDGASSPHNHPLVAGRVGKFVEQDDSPPHAQTPYKVVYEDAKEPKEEWISRVCLDSIFSRVDGRQVHAQLARDDFVRVLKSTDGPAAASASPAASPTKTAAQEKAASSASHGASRPAKIMKNYGNARYRVEYLDDQLPATDSHVNRDRIQPLTEHVMYEGEVAHVYLVPANSKSTTLAVNYDLLLKNGALVEGIHRNQLRSKEDTFTTDRYILGAIFAPQLTIQDAGEKKPNVSTMATKLNDLWGNNQIVKVYVILPSPVASIQLRDATTNKLMQVRLQERSEAKPRFVDHCHGYIKGGNFSSSEKDKLAHLYDAAVTQRLYNSHDTGNAPAEEPFEIDNCVCVLLAPQPRMEIHGTIALSSSTESLGLFKALLALQLKHPLVFSKLVQKIVRSTASFELPLNRKERVLMIDKVDICFSKISAQKVELNALTSKCVGDVIVDVKGKKTVTRGTVALKNVSIEVHFHLVVPHNNRDSLAAAVAIAFQDANQITKHLGACNSLILADFGLHDSLVEAVYAGHGIWIMEKTGANPDLVVDKDRKLVVEVMNRKGDKGTHPSISLELVPLDDVRLSVKSLNSDIEEICLPAEKLETEAKLRRALTPFHGAKVVSGPLFYGKDHPKQQQIRKPLGLKTAVPPYYEIKYTDLKKPSDVVPISQDDLKFDRMHVQVVQMTQMFIKNKADTSNGIRAEVMLVSRDFEPQMASEQALRPPHGVVLTPTGEICVDMARNRYPESSSVELFRGTDPGIWIQTKETKRADVFGHPGFDLERVAAVRIRLLDRSKKGSETLIGTTEIPMDEIVRNQIWSQEEHAKHEQKTEATSKAGPAPKAADSVLKTQIFSVERLEDDRKVVVGKITLSIERTHRIAKDDQIQAKSFGTEDDLWTIDPYELLVTTLKHHENKLTRGLLAAGSPMPCGGRVKLTARSEQEVQLQKILNVMMIAQAMEKIKARHAQLKAEKQTAATADKHVGGALALKHGHKVQSPRAMDQLKIVLKQTKAVVEGTAVGLGIINPADRLPWSGDRVHTEKERGDMVVFHANVATSTIRLRRTILKLFDMYRHRLIPTLQELYMHDAKGDDIDVVAGEKMLRIFEEEVEDLDEEDQAVYRRVYQRLRLRKICQVLHDIMGTTLRVRIMDQNPYDHDTIGMAQIPLLDLIDQEEHFNSYKLMKPSRGRHANALQLETRAELGLLGDMKHKHVSTNQGKVHLRLRLTYAESALLEQAIHVYKFLKAKYIMQHETARRRINAAVIPAQRRRWMIVKGYLDELKSQSTGKLHWERTPILLSLVWDIFASHKKAITKPDSKASKEDQLEGLAEKVDEYRSAVVEVHKRWANIQPMLDELLVIQAAAQIHAQRTPYLLEKIEKELEGLDIVLSTAWQQVNKKWEVLRKALEELVVMKENNKIHLGRAPQLLNTVSQKCSKGLNDRYAEAVSNVQFRWMAITQRDGPLCELRLMEKKGLHWRRTHELVLLLNEQCEGFADVDAKALDIVESRWKQVQEWLDDVLAMHHDHKIDCEATPFILKKMHLIEHKVRAGDHLKHGGPSTLSQQGATASSPTKRSLTVGLSSMSLRSSGGGDIDVKPGANSPPVSPRGHSIAVVDCGEVDAGRLEGLIEWYAIEEAKYELERIPRHRITTDHDRNNWLPFSHDGKDTRLMITQEEMAFTPANIRAALEDRGVIPKFSSFLTGVAKAKTVSGAGGSTGTPSASSLPKDLLEEIDQLELAVENKHVDDVRHQVLSNPERFAELYTVIENLGKTDLLWKISHVVNANKELEVPTSFTRLLDEMKMRQIPTTDIENLVRTLTVVLQKEELLKVGIDVPSTANFTTVLSLMHRHQVMDVSLPLNTAGIQTLLQERGMDRKGESIFLRGMRIGTQSVISDDTAVNTGVKATTAKSTSATPSPLNTCLGLIDTHIELLRKSLLFEALRKRNSLIKTFPGETKVLSDEHVMEYAEVDMSGDYMTLIERFQQLLIHESYTKRLASYAALDRCMRALVKVSRDQIVTKEDIAIALHDLRNSQYRLPLEAFTRDELVEAASRGKIRTPTEQMLNKCPHGKNAIAMAFYAAMCHAAMVYQELTSFSSRFDPTSSRFQDSLPYDEKSSIDGQVIPKDRSRLGIKATIVDWLLGSEDRAMRIHHHLGAYHQQRLIWSAAAFMLCNRWFQRGYGWCDDASKGVGVKVLLQKLLIFEAANKMHMVHTKALLDEVNDKCTNLRAREKAAKEILKQRFDRNVEMLEKLVGHAEKCINNRKLHSEETPALLHAIEQVCVVPKGLNARHMEAYHVVTSHWIPHRARLDELVKMQKEGTFSIHRTPELLNSMEFHTEGIAGADELDEESIYAMVGEGGDIVGNQQELLERKIDEIRRGQRKMPSSLHLDLQEPDVAQATTEAAEVEAQARAREGKWNELSPSKKLVQPLDPRQKHTSWKVTTGDTTSDSGEDAKKPSKQSIMVDTKVKRKSSLGDEIKELLKSPSKWLLESNEPTQRIRPEFFFPKPVSHDASHVTPTAPLSTK